ncbi:MAG: hypothetical protein WD063_17555 [Pirellulales bacterium]
MAILPFSKRNAPPPARYRYDVPERARRRIFISLQQRSGHGVDFLDLDTLLVELGDLIAAADGGLFSSMYEAARVSDHPVINHFMLCHDVKALEWIEFVFQCFHYSCGDEWRQAVNEILKQEPMGYELTPYVETTVKGPDGPAGVPRHRWGKGFGEWIEHQYPQIIKKDDEYTHAEIIQPCLNLLSDPKFKTANEEMLKAHKEYREGNYADAITDCGSAFETVMKTICEAKGWPYDKGKATCKDLVAICKDKGLFPSFYVSFFEGAGTIRNKLGDAHGKGPTPDLTATKEHFEHMVQITSANILFLARLARMD